MDKMHSDYLVERFHPKESKKNIFCWEQKNSFCNINDDDHRQAHTHTHTVFGLGAPHTVKHRQMW